MRRLYRLIARILIVSMAWMPFPAQAAMVGTDQVNTSAQHRVNRDTVVDFLGRGDVARQLEAAGLSAATAKERVDAMTQEEINRLAGKIDSVPAGAADGWIWAIAIIAIVLYLVWYKK